MQRVLLQDELAEQFGAVHEYHNLRAPIDAIRLLCLNFPDFKQHLIESGKNGIGYRVVQAEIDLELEDLILPFGRNDLVITPVITGSGKGGGAILAGVALIGLAVVTGGVGLGLGGGAMFGTLTGSSFLSSAIAIGGNMGIALTLGGISNLLAPQPQDQPRFSIAGGTPEIGPQASVRGADGRQSYAFTGPVNSVGAGKTVPIAYGKTMIGGHIVSANMQITDDSDERVPYIRKPGASSVRVQGYEIDGMMKWKSMSGMYGIRYEHWEDLHFWGSNAGGTGAIWAQLVRMESGVRYKEKITELPLGEPGTTIGFGQESGASSGQGLKLEKDQEYPANRFQIAFELNNGFYQYASPSNPDSTKIDGFLKIKVNVWNWNAQRVAGINYITVQGLLQDTDTYRFVVEYPVTKWSIDANGKPVTWADNHSVSLRIEEEDVASGCLIGVRRAGTWIIPQSNKSH